MGLFSSKRIVNVSATVYNLAGDENDRPQYLRDTIFSSVISNAPSLSDSIVTAHLQGPGIMQRSFYSYSKRNNLSGLLSTVFSINSSFSPADITPHIPVESGNVAEVSYAEISSEDAEPFIIKWIVDNEPERETDDTWVAEFLRLDGTTPIYTVEFVSDGAIFEVPAVGYEEGADYVYARYVETRGSTTSPFTVVSDDIVPSVPNLDEYNIVSNVINRTPVVIQRQGEERRIYTDGNPDEVYPYLVSYNDEENRDVTVYEYTENAGFNNQFGLETIVHRRTITGVPTLVSDYFYQTTNVVDQGGGHTLTTVITEEGDNLVQEYRDVYETSTIVQGQIADPGSVFIYKVGTGNAVLDALVSAQQTGTFDGFFPFLPLRINNVSLRATQYVDNGLYGETKTAYRRVSGGSNLDSLLDSIEDNPSIGDIDYAYLMFGVSLNTPDAAARRYVSSFIEELYQRQDVTSSEMLTFIAQITDYNERKTLLDNWLNNPSGPRPTLPTFFSVPSSNSIQMKASSAISTKFDMRILWSHIAKDELIGGFSFVEQDGTTRLSEEGDVQLVAENTINWTTYHTYLGNATTANDGNPYTFIVPTDHSMNVASLYHQVSHNEYIRYRLYGMQHRNYIYNYNGVIINASAAANDDEESGFIFPLHIDIMKELGIVDYTQMSSVNSLLVFNSYTVTTQKWYQRGFFKILLVVVFIAVAVFAAPAAFGGATGGILGTNAAIGASLGFAGTSALVAGAIANSLASIVVSNLLTEFSAELFGEEFASLFAALATFAFGALQSGGFTFGAEGILELGNTLANGYSGWVQADIINSQELLKVTADQYEEQIDKIEELTQKLQGGTGFNFNPLDLTNAAVSRLTNGYSPESVDEFVSRTTMTGSELVDIVHSMVYDFPEIQRTLPKN